MSALISNIPKLPHFLRLPCAMDLALKGIKIMGQLFKEGKFRNFADLCKEYNVPSKRLFLYFQLRHATASQLSGLVGEQVNIPLGTLLCS